ncbi:MAG: hypothetical protein ACTSR2_00360 [Candidatus Hodarchaeales archaeon]
MQLTPENCYKMLTFKMTFINKRVAGYLMPRCFFLFMPKRTDVLNFTPIYFPAWWNPYYQPFWFTETRVTVSCNPARIIYSKSINEDNIIVNCVMPFLYAMGLTPSDVEYALYAIYFPSEEINEKSVSSVFNTTTIPITTKEFLSYNTEEIGQSLAKISINLLSGWTYNENKYSSRALHYLIKITQSGGLGEAKFVWTKLPISIRETPPEPDSNWWGHENYALVDATSLYSEAIPIYFQDANTIRCYTTTFEFNDPIERYKPTPLFYLDSNAIWAESRRRNPETKDVYVFLALRPDKKTIVAFESYFEFEPEKILEVEMPFDVKQVTWFNDRIIVLEDSDPYRIHVLDLDTTTTQIAETSIAQGSEVLLVAHPDQDVCYLFGEDEQWIIYDDLSHETTTFDLTGLVSFTYLQFDIDGNVWFGGSKRDKQLLTELVNVPNARCNYTYIAVDNGDGTYSAFHLDGTTPIYNLPEEYLGPLFWSNIAYKYPQKVLTPYNATDLQLLTQNGDLTSPHWYGWDGSSWVDFDEQNSRLIDSTSIEIEDGVELNFDFTEGGFVENEYFYFTVVEGIVKDSLSEVEVKRVFDLRFWEYHYIDIALVLSNLIDNGDGTYSYYVPESANANFWELDTFLAKATFDDPEQVGAGVDAELITGGTPTSGQVHVETSTGKLTFAQEDIGRTFQMHYYVVIDTTCPF